MRISSARGSGGSVGMLSRPAWTSGGMGMDVGTRGGSGSSNLGLGRCGGAGRGAGAGAGAGARRVTVSTCGAGASTVVGAGASASGSGSTGTGAIEVVSPKWLTGWGRAFGSQDVGWAEVVGLGSARGVVSACVAAQADSGRQARMTRKRRDAMGFPLKLVPFHSAPQRLNKERQNQQCAASIAFPWRVRSASD